MLHSSVGMKFVLQYYSCLLLLFLFSYTPKKALQSSNFSVKFQEHMPPDSLQYTVQFNRSLSLGLDTGHGLTLAQTCDVTTGSSYSPIRCNETECFEFWVERGELFNYTTQMCDYKFHESSGTLSRVVNLIDGFPAGFVLGCGEQGAEPMFRLGVDGVLGLGRGGELSFLPQTNNTRFSYCLPSTSTSTGYFTFNNHDDDHDAPLIFSFTPFAHPIASSNYFVDIVAITVGGTLLPIDYQSVIRGTVIDTGSLITRLPPAAYVTMRDEFRRQMGTEYTAPQQFPIFDTCYNTTNLDSMSITPPPVSFTFKDSVTVDLDASGILYDLDYAYLRCFAFAPSDYKDDSIPFDHSYHTDFVIFASAQQRTLEMVFDVANDKLGFRQNGCA